MTDTERTSEYPQDAISDSMVDDSRGRQRAWKCIRLGLLCGIGFYGGNLLGQLGDQDTARKNAVTAQACYDAYPSESSSDMLLYEPSEFSLPVSKNSVECMKKGWGTQHAVHPITVREGSPGELLGGYIESQQNQSNYFNFEDGFVMSLVVAGVVTVGRAALTRPS